MSKRLLRDATDAPLKVLWIWHAAVVAEYQKPLSILAHCARPRLDLTLIVPKRWPERAGEMVHAEAPATPNFRLIKAHALFTGFYYVYFYPALLYHLLRHRPDVIYCYEEAHTLIAAMVLLYRRLFLPRTRVLLYAAQNIRKRYPRPFRIFERYCFKRADAILACGHTVAATLRSKGYAGGLRVVPLPVDTMAYRPDHGMRTRVRRELGIKESAFVVGYAGKLVEEKGLHTLWEAFEALARDHEDAHLLLLGGGPMLDELRASAEAAGLSGRLHLPGVVHNSALPTYMNAMDAFALPSETRRNWREQFGRAIVEAMSCGVPVVGSDSGEIPNVIGDAGLVFPEGHATTLAAHLRLLARDEPLRARLAQHGRQRALNLYSLERVASQHHQVYRVLSARVPSGQ